MPASRVPGDDMAGAAGRLHVDPLDLEAKRLELGAEHSAHAGHPGKVQGPAVLVDPFLQHRERAGLFRIDGSDHRLLDRRKRRGGRRRKKSRERGERMQDS